jgi:hypothetical protein
MAALRLAATALLFAAEAQAAIVKPATPMLGWSSWNRLKNEVNETVIKQMADAMVSTGLRDAGYRSDRLPSSALPPDTQTHTHTHTHTHTLA